MDILFLDWEKPRRVLAKGGGREEPGPVSAWRTLLVANEWNELQTSRFTCPTFTLLTAVSGSCAAAQHIASPAMCLAWLLVCNVLWQHTDRAKVICFQSAPHLRSTAFNALFQIGTTSYKLPFATTGASVIHCLLVLLPQVFILQGAGMQAAAYINPNQDDFSTYQNVQQSLLLRFAVAAVWFLVLGLAQVSTPSPPNPPPPRGLCTGVMAYSCLGKGLRLLVCTHASDMYVALLG